MNSRILWSQASIHIPLVHCRPRLCQHLPPAQNTSMALHFPTGYEKPCPRKSDPPGETSIPAAPKSSLVTLPFKCHFCCKSSPSLAPANLSDPQPSPRCNPGVSLCISLWHPWHIPPWTVTEQHKILFEWYSAITSGLSGPGALSSSSCTFPLLGEVPGS